MGFAGLRRGMDGLDDLGLNPANRPKCKRGSMSVIRTEDLGKTYKGGTAALRGLDLTVNEAEVFGFLGPNGAGKSTTIQLLLNFLRPSA